MKCPLPLAYVAFSTPCFPLIFFFHSFSVFFLYLSLQSWLFSHFSSRPSSLRSLLGQIEDSPTHVCLQSSRPTNLFTSLRCSPGHLKFKWPKGKTSSAPPPQSSTQKYYHHLTNCSKQKPMSFLTAFSSSPPTSKPSPKLPSILPLKFLSHLFAYCHSLCHRITQTNFNSSSSLTPYNPIGKPAKGENGKFVTRIQMTNKRKTWSTLWVIIHLT